MGLATDAERQEFERMCTDYPEIAAARDAFESSLEEQLLKDAIAPPAFVKEKILQATAPAIESDGLSQTVEEVPVRRINIWKWVAAASLLLLAGVGYWVYTTNEKYNELEARQNAMQKQLEEKNSELAALKTDAQMLYKPGMKMVSLKGTPDAPQAYTTVYWDTTSPGKDVYLMINNLPQPPSEKQYQLWALFNGQPIDLGVFDFDVRQKRLLVRMKNVQNAQAFAITLERRGRTNPEKPEGQIYVVGNL